jgi:hypothetical protein
MEEDFILLYKRAETGDGDEKSIGWSRDQAELSPIRYLAVSGFQSISVCQHMDGEGGEFQSRHSICETLTSNHLVW